MFGVFPLAAVQLAAVQLSDTLDVVVAPNAAAGGAPGLGVGGRRVGALRPAAGEGAGGSAASVARRRGGTGKRSTWESDAVLVVVIQ